jgi:hypothetical protein
MLRAHYHTVPRDSTRVGTFGLDNFSARAHTGHTDLFRIPWLEVFMVTRYDIFRMTAEDNFMWIEAVEDLPAAKKRLLSLASTKPGDYRVWDPSRQQFVDISRQRFKDCA